MKLSNLLLITILVISLFNINGAFTVLGEENLCNLSVKVSGTNDYDPHHELVLIRLYNDSNSNGSPILTMTRTDDDDIAHFTLEPGDYWIDVRNVWVRLLLEDDTFFEYPNLLYMDSPPWSGNETDQPDNVEPQKYVFVAFALVFIFAIFASLFVYVYLKTKKQSEKEKQEEQQEAEKEDQEDTEEQKSG